GVLEDLLRRPDLLDAPLVHDHDPIRHLEGLLLIVGDEHAGDVNLVVQAAEPRAQLLAHLRIERAEGLVEEQDLGLRGKRPGECDALALAARELGRQRALESFELHEPEQLRHARPDLRPGPLADAEAERDVVEHRHVTEERVVLEDEAHVALAHGGVGHVLVLVQHAAGVRRLQPRDDAQQRRLARARRAEQREERAVWHLETDVVESQDASEALHAVLDGDAHASPPAFSRRSFSASSRRVFHSSVVFTRSVTSASSARTDATANAPGMLYSWNSFSTRNGMVSVWPAMWPDTTYTAPNSPIARALHRMTPYARPHLMLGTVTRQNICQPLAPRLTAAISSSAPIAPTTGISPRAPKGHVTNAPA